MIEAEKPAPEIARAAIELVRPLYAVERQAKDVPADERLDLRQGWPRAGEASRVEGSLSLGRGRSGSPLGPLLQYFFTDHMLSHRRASQQTVDSYRDTFRLLLHFLQQSTGKEPASLRVGDLDAPAILSFLDHIEQQRKNQIQARNVRLAAIRSFFRLVALRDPASIQFVTRVLAIPLKRANKRLVGYLTRPEMDAILGVPDRKTWDGQRDYTLLLAFYNSGARVSELTSLKRSQIRLGATSFLHLHGKGRKERGSAMANNCPVFEAVAGGHAGTTRQSGVPERAWGDLVAGRSELRFAGRRAGGRENLPQPDDEARLAACPAPHHGDAPAAGWSRHHRGRTMAGPRKSGDNTDLR